MILIFTFDNQSDMDKFEFLYTRYKRLLLHKAYSILHDYQLAEDAVSDTYIRIYKNLHKIDDPSSNQTIAFVVTIAKNAALTMLNRQKKQCVEEYDEQQPSEINLEEDVLSAMSSEKIYSVVDRLEEELKGVFMLKYAYDYSNKEIAKLLCISENNVGVRLHRAKKKLAALLEKEAYAV